MKKTIPSVAVSNRKPLKHHDRMKMLRQQRVANILGQPLVTNLFGLCPFSFFGLFDCNSLNKPRSDATQTRGCFARCWPRPAPFPLLGTDQEFRIFPELADGLMGFCRAARMSALGQKRTKHRWPKSGFVRYGPKADKRGVQLDCPRSANRDRCTAANGISIRSPRRRAEETPRGSSAQVPSRSLSLLFWRACSSCRSGPGDIRRKHRATGAKRRASTTIFTARDFPRHSFSSYRLA